MTELNDLDPVEIHDCRPFSFKIKCDTKLFKAYTRQGIVENVKVPNIIQFKSLAEVIEDPAGATQYGFLENPSMKYMGMQRSEKLHIAYRAVHAFMDDHNGSFPQNNEEDF